MCNKKVSIITATYNLVSKNQKSYFYEMFRSIHEQDYPYIEHIIVDGESNDGSIEFIRNIINKYAKKEIKFVSKKDKNLNEATNYGFSLATGEYITLMCDDDFYTNKFSISKLMDKIIQFNYDYIYSDTWWLNREIWLSNDKDFAWRHPFLINACIFKKEILGTEVYLNEKYPMVGDYDFFMRLLKKENVQGGKVKDVLTVLRSGGYSQSDPTQYISEIKNILQMHFDSKFISGEELWNELHSMNPSILLLLKIKFFCKNKKIKDSVFNAFSIKRCIKKYIRFITGKLEYFLFLKFITKYFRKKKKQITQQKVLYTRGKAREWIETFYNVLY